MSKATIIAFFDVDETLIRTKSMFAFMRFLDQHNMIADADEVIEGLRRLSDKGIDRSEINRIYWRSYKGLEAESVREAARKWFDEAREKSDEFFIACAMDRLRIHKSAGHQIVLVSGSSIDILQPLAKLIDADFILATRLQEKNGYYTGEIIPPVMIGAGKAQSAKQLASRLKVQTHACFAYGDHLSDLPLLELVGNPTVLGDEGALVDHAHQVGWPILSQRCVSKPGVAA
ncbi:HAD-IB family hydrolase [Agrobacterium sp. BT-220-3]|nr:HAD-IB family hydrolase [Agrobacterium sp. BT-220-3]